MNRSDRLITYFITISITCLDIDRIVNTLVCYTLPASWFIVRPIVYPLSSQICEALKIYLDCKYGFNNKGRSS